MSLVPKPNHWYWRKRNKRSVPSASPSPTTPGPFSTHFSYGAIGYGPTGATGAVSSDSYGMPEMKDLGLAIEPIVGWRSFDISVDEGFSLHSLNGTFWPPYEPLAAYCGSNVLVDHEVPHLPCMCGIYAWKSNNSMGNVTLWGEVYLWGDVLIYSDGYRAELAYPKALHISAHQTRANKRIRDGLQETYGIPVTFTDRTTGVEKITQTYTALYNFNTTSTNPPFLSGGST